MFQKNAMLIELNISVWTARRLDRGVSAAVDASNNTKTRAGNYHKNLLAGTDALRNIAAFVREVRDYYYVNTLPWSDGGVRILPAKKFMEFNTYLVRAQEKFEQDVSDFLYMYPDLISAAAFSMGNLFDRSEYPSVDDLRTKFGFRFSYTPIPQAGDFRVDVGNDAMQELREQYDSVMNNKVQEATKDIWRRLSETITRIANQVDFTDTNRKNIYASMLVSARELCEMVPDLNIEQDLEIDAVRDGLLNAIEGVSTEDIKSSQDVRDDLKAKMDKLSSLVAL